jgi:hypothetical protein
MEQDTQNKLVQLEEKIDAVFVSVEKTRKYFLIIMWVSIIAIVLPAIGLVFAIPAFLNTYSSMSGVL